MESRAKRSSQAPAAETDAGVDAPGRDLELALARERHALKQLRLVQRQLVEAERSAARAAQLQHELEATAASHALQTTALRRQIEQLEHGVRGLEAANADLRRELEATVAHFESVNEGLMNSLSWRITRPLRALKALRG